MPEKAELTPAMVQHARLAGIPADRPGLLGEYPRMMYKLGVGLDHQLFDEHLKIDGKHDAQTLVVENEDEELAAGEEGWVRSLSAIGEKPIRGRATPPA